MVVEPGGVLPVGESWGGRGRGGDRIQVGHTIYCGEFWKIFRQNTMEWICPTIHRNL